MRLGWERSTVCGIMHIIHFCISLTGGVLMLVIVGRMLLVSIDVLPSDSFGVVR